MSASGSRPTPARRVAPACAAALLALAAASTPARAELPERCARTRTQVDLDACVAADRHRAEARLEVISGAYRARLPHDDARRRFDEVQQAWMRYREASCGFETSGVEGGSAHGAVLSGCLAEVTRELTRRVRALLDCREGDLSCPALSPPGAKAPAAGR